MQCNIFVIVGHGLKDYFNCRIKKINCIEKNENKLANISIFVNLSVINLKTDFVMMTREDSLYCS